MSHQDLALVIRMLTLGLPLTSREGAPGPSTIASTTPAAIPTAHGAISSCPGGNNMTLGGAANAVSILKPLVLAPLTLPLLPQQLQQQPLVSGSSSLTLSATVPRSLFASSITASSGPVKKRNGML